VATTASLKLTEEEEEEEKAIAGCSGMIRGDRQSLLPSMTSTTVFKPRLLQEITMVQLIGRTGISCMSNAEEGGRIKGGDTIETTEELQEEIISSTSSVSNR
jgi:hypothetical protein